MNWTITQIKVSNDPLQGEIVNVSFLVSDGVSQLGSDTNLLPASYESFTPLESTTEEQVVQWVKDALNANDKEDDISGVDKFEAMVAKKTNAIQPQVVPLPWES